MGNRNPLPWFLSALAVGGVALGAGVLAPAAAQSSRSMGVEHLASRPSSQASSGITVAWTFRGEDLFACASAAYDLRALIREHGSQIAIQAIAIDADPNLVNSFLRRERLDLAVTYTTTQQYRRAFGEEPVPSVSVKQRGRLVEALNTGQLQVRGRRDTRSLQELVSQLLRRTRYSLTAQ